MFQKFTSIDHFLTAKTKQPQPRRIKAPINNGALLRYFVVTHRLIVEAEDETSAARLAAGKIASASDLAFEVESEGVAARRVTVPGTRQMPQDAVQAPVTPLDDGETASPRGPEGQAGNIPGADNAEQGTRTAQTWVSRGAGLSLAISLVCLILSVFARYG